MKIKLKKLKPEAVIPHYSRFGDAGMDITAIQATIHPNYTEYHTGIACEIPEGYVGLIFPRSSVSNIENCYMANSVGVIDSNFRGEITIRFRGCLPYKPGQRIAQMVILPYPKVQFEEVAELSSTNRGGNGYGSSGN